LIQSGEISMRAAMGSECAADQGRFWEMRTAIYARQSELYGADGPDAALGLIAADLKLDVPTFASCMATNPHTEMIVADYAAAQREGVNTRPVFDINGQRLIGGQRFERFAGLIK
jgi:protein-disulfide isomerase